MYHQLLLWIMQDSIEWVSYRFYVKSLVINFYLFLPIHLSTILLRINGLILKSISKRYCQVAILFSSLCRLILVSIDYIFEKIKRQTPKMTFVFVLKKAFAFFFIYQLKVSQYLAKYHKLGSLLLLPDLPGPAD